MRGSWATSPPIALRILVLTGISNPTTSALGAAYAELASGGADRLRLWDATIHAALASQLKAGDRVVAPLAVYGSTRTQLIETFARFGVRVDFVDMTDNAAAAAAIAAAPTRVVYAETIANPTTVVTDHGRSPASPTSTAPPTSSTTRSPRRTSAGRWSHGADLVVESATKFCPATATSSPGWSRAART